MSFPNEGSGRGPDAIPLRPVRSTAIDIVACVDSKTARRRAYWHRESGPRPNTSKNFSLGRGRARSMSVGKVVPLRRLLAAFDHWDMRSFDGCRRLGRRFELGKQLRLGSQPMFPIAPLWFALLFPY